MATGNFELYFASEHSMQLLPVYATRLTETHATIGGKRHALRDSKGTLQYYTSKVEAYKAVLALRLASTKKYAQMLTEVDLATDDEPWEALESITYMINMKNDRLRNWVLYGEALKKEGLAL